MFRSTFRAAIFTSLLLHTPALSAESDPANAVVARIGSRTVTVRDLEARLAAVPAFQRESLGPTPEAVKRAFLERVIVPEILLEEGAAAKQIDQELGVRQKLLRARSAATVRALRARIGDPSSVSPDAIKRYFEDNRARFETPERYNLWRILCKTREEAVSVLEAAKKDGQLATFQELAQNKSIDKATYLRGGNLGFLNAEGVSNEPGLKVEPQIVKAAMLVKDGEFVPNPVEEASAWAVIWRRGTVGATRRTLEEQSPQIRDILLKQRVAEAQTKLVSELRAREVREVNEGLLQVLPALQGETVVPRKRPALP